LSNSLREDQKLSDGFPTGEGKRFGWFHKKGQTGITPVTVAKESKVGTKGKCLNLERKRVRDGQRKPSSRAPIMTKDAL